MIDDGAPAMTPAEAAAYRAGVLAAHAGDDDFAALDLELSTLEGDELRAVCRHLAVVLGRELRA